MNRNTHAPGRKSSASNRDAINRRADDALATAGRDNAFPESEATPQVLREAKDNFRLVEEVRWQLSGARQTAANSQKGERRGVCQFGVPPKTARRDSANFLPEGNLQVVSEARDNKANCPWVQHFIHHLAPPTALRDSAIHQCEASQQVVSAAKNNMVALPGQLV